MLPYQRNHMRNSNIKNTIYVKDNNTHMYAKFQPHPPYDLRWRFLNIFFENLAFRLAWQPIKISDFDKIHMVGRGLCQEHFCNMFAKISAVTQK